MLELEGDAAVGAHVAAVLVEGVANVGDGARLVVGEAVDHHRSAADAVAFIADLDVIDAFEFAGALLDRVVDLVLGHIDCLALVDGQAQARVEARIAAAHLGGDGDFLGDLGKSRATLLILPTLTVLDVGPFTVSCHDYPRAEMRPRPEVGRGRDFDYTVLAPAAL